MLAYDVHSRVAISQEQRWYFCPYLKHEFSAFVKLQTRTNLLIGNNISLTVSFCGDQNGGVEEIP